MATNRLPHLSFALGFIALLSNACASGPDDLVPDVTTSDDSSTGSPGTGGGTGGGNPGSGGGGSPGSGGSGTGGLMPVETVACVGAFPTEDTSGSAHIVTAGA